MLAEDKGCQLPAPARGRVYPTLSASNCIVLQAGSTEQPGNASCPQFSSEPRANPIPLCERRVQSCGKAQLEEMDGKKSDAHRAFPRISEYVIIRL